MKEEPIFLKTDTHYLQIPYQLKDGILSMIKVPRQIMFGINRITDDELVHSILYDENYKVLGLIFHKKDPSVHKPEIEIIPEIHYYGLVDKEIFTAFMTATNKKWYFETFIKDMYPSCIEAIKPYFL